MRTPRIVVVLCILAVACGGSTTGGPSEGGSDGRSDGGAGKDGTADRAGDRVVKDQQARDQGVPESGGDENAPSDGSNACHSVSDCTGYSGYFGCLQYTLPPTCGGACTGTPYTDQCMSDSDCVEAGAGHVCSSLCACAFTGGYDAVGPWCILACTSDADCGPGNTCAATRHCEATPCTLASDCPANFVCSSSACAPAPCKKDGDCKDGYFCTNAGFDTGGGPGQLFCAPHLGVCQPAGA